MATLKSRQILLLRKYQKNAIASLSKRTMAGVRPWNYLWKPGPYPETEEGTYLYKYCLISTFNLDEVLVIKFGTLHLE